MKQWKKPDFWQLDAKNTACGGFRCSGDCSTTYPCPSGRDMLKVVKEVVEATVKMCR